MLHSFALTHMLRSLTQAVTPILSMIFDNGATMRKICLDSLSPDLTLKWKCHNARESQLTVRRYSVQPVFVPILKKGPFLGQFMSLILTIRTYISCLDM